MDFDDFHRNLDCFQLHQVSAQTKKFSRRIAGCFDNINVHSLILRRGFRCIYKDIHSLD